VIWHVLGRWPCGSRISGMQAAGAACEGFGLRMGGTEREANPVGLWVVHDPVVAPARGDGGLGGILVFAHYSYRLRHGRGTAWNLYEQDSRQLVFPPARPEHDRLRLFRIVALGCRGWAPSSVSLPSRLDGGSPSS
jgi:hypothetical protein